MSSASSKSNPAMGSSSESASIHFAGNSLSSSQLSLTVIFAFYFDQFILISDGFSLMTNVFVNYLTFSSKSVLRKAKRSSLESCFKLSFQSFCLNLFAKDSQAKFIYHLINFLLALFTALHIPLFRCIQQTLVQRAPKIERLSKTFE